MSKLLDRVIPHRFAFANFLVWYFIAGMIYVHLRAEFLPYERTIWDDIYYIWNNGLFLMLFILVRCFVPKEDRTAWNILIFYSLIRLLWEIASPVTNKVEINHPTTVTVLFSILLTGGIVLLWKDLQKRKREGI